MKRIEEQYIKKDYKGTFYFRNLEMTILHRADGPAEEYANGEKYWWWCGEKVSQERHQEYLEERDSFCKKV